MVLVIADSKMKAGDNGEYFYEYVRANHPDDKLYFVLSVNSTDYNRLKKKGFNLIDTDNGYIKYIFEKSDYILTSKCQYPFGTEIHSRYYDKSVFLNHGISSNVNHVNGYFGNIIDNYFKYICAASDNDKNILINTFGMKKSDIIVTGFARWDNLIKKNCMRTNHNKPHILMTFHWRYGELKSDSRKFFKSDYLKNINKLLNCEEIKKISEKCEITFMYHAMFSKYSNYFKVPNYINAGSKLQFQDMLVDADAIVTDFSSNAYEMAVIDKPTFYYIPDYDYVINNIKEYDVKSLKENCIGKFCNNQDELISTIDNFASGEFELTRDNKNNIFNLIGNVDLNNCDRIYNYLVKELENRKMSSTEVKEERIIHTGGIWNKAMKMKAMVDDGSKKRIKVGDKFIFV